MTLEHLATLTTDHSRHLTAQAHHSLKKRWAIFESTCRQNQQNRSLIAQALAVFTPIGLLGADSRRPNA